MAKTKVKWITSSVLVLMVLTSCRPIATPTPATSTAPTPTRTTLPQEIILSSEMATATLDEAATPLPVLVLSQPTQQAPLQQITTTAGVSKPALVQIDSPGPGSKVRDFIWVRANVYPGDGGNVHLLLTGEDGRVIAERALTYSNWSTGWLSIAEQLYFTPAAASEKALLSVYTLDWYNRIIAWTSVEMLLLQVGPEEIEQPGFGGDPFVISQPQAGSAATRGVLHLEGYSHLARAGKTTIELVNSDGSVSTSQELQLPVLPDNKQYAPFSADLPYQVQGRTPVRVILKQTSSEFNGQILAVSSLILYLDP